MNSKELRNKYLDFFEKKGHKVISSASLLPENDPSVLFTTAGMQPLVPYLLGEKHPAGDKIVDIQKCLRTVDIDEVGDKTHCTFFEMLGYWSLGAYWKKEAISFTFEFLTKELNIDLNKLAVTCFEGDEVKGIARDTESAEIWQSLGIPTERMAFLGYEDNWWGPAGTEGPCGPDTEIFMWTGAGDPPVKFDPSDKNWVEIGNDVFMAYNKNAEGKLEPLAQRNVDFGAGFERVLMTLNGYDEVFKSDLFTPIIEKIEEISGLEYGDKTDEEYIAEDKQCWVDVRKQIRIIADHIRAATLLINDGALPSNKDAGYIVRRLIRRAIIKGKKINPHDNAFSVDPIDLLNITKEVFKVYKGVYEFNEVLIINELTKEIEKFGRTLEQGLKEFEKVKKDLNGAIAFKLYETFGFPLEMTEEIARESGIKIDKTDFEKAFREHQELSRTASAGMFKGGLADAGEQTKRLHTAAHLMLAALRRVLGDHVYQKGSNITPERLRFDFSHSEKMTPDQIKKVEDLVNEQIGADLPVDMQEMTLEDAKDCGAMGVFESKYGEKVKVYSIGDSSTPDGHSEPPFSREICGGPHATRTGELGHFRIVKEESSSAGVRRIKAILE